LTQTAALLWERPGSSRGIVVVPLCLAGLVFGGAAVSGCLRRLGSARRAAAPRSFQDMFALHAIALGGMAAVGLPWFGEMLPDRAALALQEFRSDIYVQQDALAQLQSYYEDLNTVTVQSGPLLTALAPQDARRQNAGDEFFVITRPADVWMDRELIPGWKGELAGHTVTINQHGMRDRASLTVRKPADTARIALVGSSVIMGYAVGDDEVFGLQFESLLNEQRRDGPPRIEVLNFGMGGQGPLHRLALVEQKVLAFEPDAIYYFAHQDELRASLAHFNALVSTQVPLKYPFLEEIVRNARITPDSAPGVSMVRLAEPARLSRVVEGAYQTLAADSRSRGVLPVWIYCPIPGIPDAPDLAPELIPIATQAGFVVLNLNDWHVGYDPSDLKAGAADHHLNEYGHRILAERLFEAVTAHPEALPGGVTGTTGARSETIGAGP
ncbi:MAG: SGNH/GDSL hydrolase family protein, partial [Planctomycetaceae bacterium]